MRRIDGVNLITYLENFILKRSNYEHLNNSIELFQFPRAFNSVLAAFDQIMKMTGNLGTSCSEDVRNRLPKAPINEHFDETFSFLRLFGNDRDQLPYGRTCPLVRKSVIESKSSSSILLFYPLVTFIEC